MKTKHTRGPWEIKIHDKGIYFTEVEVWHKNYSLLARMPDITSIWNSDKNEVVAKIQLELTIANAKVMAAGPELLDALRNLLFVCPAEFKHENPQTTEIARAAIKKATS